MLLFNRESLVIVISDIHLGDLYCKIGEFESFLVNLLQDLTRKSILVEGQVKQKYPIKEFTRKDGATGMVGSLILRDSTGIVRIIFE